MNFWARFSRTIFKIVLFNRIKKIQAKSIESVLRKSTGMLESAMLDEMRSFLRSKLTPQGGFADRAGKCDIYYSLFGYFLAEALIVPEVNSPLRQYVTKVVHEDSLSGVNLFCGAILYTKLVGIDNHTKKLQNQILTTLKNPGVKQPEYTNFLGILALYYLEDYRSIKNIISQDKALTLPENVPCPLVAATIILLEIAGKNEPVNRLKLNTFYRFKGGFAAFRQAPSEDMLSTAVSLYALNFMNADIRLIKPDVMAFIDGLYHKGGFMSMQTDNDTDVEYTFYGLLGLGSI